MIEQYVSFKDLIQELQKIRSLLHYSSVNLENKEDGSPVTELDTKLNDCIISFLKKNYPNDGIVTEELKEPVKGSSQRIWFVDPLDGTKEFIKGLSEWAVQIGLVHNNEVIFGIVAPLDLGRIYYAIKDKGTFSCKLDGSDLQKLQCRDISKMEDIVILTSRSRTESKLTDFLSKHKITKQIPMGSLGVKVSAITDKKADLYVLFSGLCNLWDICAPEIILKEAGGFVGHFDGTSINYDYTGTTEVGKPIIACTKSAYELFKENKIIPS